MNPIFDADQFNMFELVSIAERKLKEQGSCRFLSIHPDQHEEAYNGEEVKRGDCSFRLRTLKAWQDLAEVCGAKLKIPAIQGDKVLLELVRLEPEKSWHKVHPEGCEKYGVESEYAKINKNDDPHFVKDYTEALERCHLREEASILNLGINRGDEFEIFVNEPKLKNLNLSLLGIDHSASAIEQAENRFNEFTKINFLCADIESLSLESPTLFDGLISINTLHGSKFDGKAVFRSTFQTLLSKRAFVILGFPNCRYIDGEVVYGGKMKNYSRHDFSLLLKDLQYYKKYLQSHKKKVYITGKYTLFLTAVAI